MHRTWMGRRGLLLLALLAASTGWAAAMELRIAAVKAGEVRDWDGRLVSMLQAGQLRLRQARADTLIPGRQHERFTQLYKGVPVFGGELVRQSDNAGTLTVFGTLYEGIDLDAAPALTGDQALRLAEQQLGAALRGRRAPELMVLPKDDGGFALTYRYRAFSKNGLWVYFLDARDGRVVMSYNDLQTQGPVGTGRGVLNDLKKISTRRQGSTFVADDQSRPPAIATFDFRGDIFKILFLESIADLQASDLAADADNDWTDGANVDAHVYAGRTYDYYFRRFGRRGLDNGDLPMLSITHPVRREDIFNDPNIDFIGTFYLNAFYAGDGLMVYGEGLPNNLITTAGQSWNFLAGALDVVAHELTHGVTDYSSQLIYRNESGALNEAFSDIIGTSVEFFYQQPGSGPLRADYLLGEDVIRGARPGVPDGLRSMQNPAAYGDPDHYSLRFLGPQDNGGVHTNSGIANQAFFLAIEGGTNRVSGLSVQGVGGGNREQIERVFYHAFVSLLPPSADFSTARAATIQSARDLYGAGSAPERAVTQAWTAVGVN